MKARYIASATNATLLDRRSNLNENEKMIASLSKLELRRLDVKLK